MALGTATPSSLRSGSSQRSRASTSAERELVELAYHTRRSIVWQKILSEQNGGSSAWKWNENVRNFSVYVNETKGVYCVLAVGSVKGSVSELQSLLVSSTQAEYDRKMFALYDKTFKCGSYIRDVSVQDIPDQESVMKVSLRTATFATSGWLKRDDEWYLLESTQIDKSSSCLEKYVTTLSPREGEGKLRDSKQGRSIRYGFRIQPKEKDGSDVDNDGSSQVYFYAETTTPSGSLRLAGGSVSKAVKQRLLHLAQSCGRLSQLVRRRRLGVQVLADERRLFPLANTQCANCDTRQLVAKLCRICGQGVCANCSAKYEREIDVVGDLSVGKSSNNDRRVRIESVRVCDPCIARVDEANYDSISEAARRGPQVYPNPARDPLSTDVSQVGTSGQADLKNLLQEALLQAPSQRRKSAVMSVIRSVLEQEKTLLQPVSEEQAYVHALQQLRVKHIPHTEADLVDLNGRGYALPRHGYPVPEEEHRRLEAIKSLDIHNDGTSDELNIICDLAAKELGTLASIITIITEESQCVIGANTPAFEKMNVPRQEAFCQHTVMDSKPLIVRHPEADVRFSKIQHTERLGIRYYCGFPLMGEGDVVIGTLCCLDRKSHEITESQYSALRKLAETASKVVRIQGEKKRSRSRLGSAAST